VVAADSATGPLVATGSDGVKLQDGLRDHSLRQRHAKIAPGASSYSGAGCDLRSWFGGHVANIGTRMSTIKSMTTTTMKMTSALARAPQTVRQRSARTMASNVASISGAGHAKPRRPSTSW
jgi:hypothetical protein